MFDWLLQLTRDYGEYLIALTILSLLSVAVVMTVGARVLARLPADYFLTGAVRSQRSYLNHFHPVLRVFIPPVKNILGVFLIVSGFVMLFVPGQGLLTMLAGTILADFPGKYACERWLVRRPQVRRAINWLRRREGESELLLDD